jgi:hypothetical protein
MAPSQRRRRGRPAEDDRFEGQDVIGRDERREPLLLGPSTPARQFCRIKDMPMAVIRTASLGEFLKGLYAMRSIPC